MKTKIITHPRAWSKAAAAWPDLMPPMRGVILRTDEVPDPSRSETARTRTMAGDYRRLLGRKEKGKTGRLNHHPAVPALIVITDRPGDHPKREAAKDHLVNEVT
jgi:hypothetical protein